MSTKMWDTTMEHARRCVIDDKKLYLYCPRSPNRDGVVFNVVGQVLGLLSDSKYIVADKLSETEQVSLLYVSHKRVKYNPIATFFKQNVLFYTTCLTIKL